MTSYGLEFRARRKPWYEVLIIVLCWLPYDTCRWIWIDTRRKIQHFWRLHYEAPLEQTPPREHFLFRGVDRPLTPPLTRPRRVGKVLTAKRQQTHDQNQAKIFKLPPELRIMIWKEVLSGYCAYPIDKQNWIYLQRRMIDRNTRHTAWALSQPSPKVFNTRTGYVAHTEILSLPLSCRRIYSETIDMLYYSNIFHFRSGLGLLSIEKQRISVGLLYPLRPEFSWRVLPQRFDKVRCLIIEHEIQHAPIPNRYLQCWVQFWRAVGQLPSLRALRVELDPRASSTQHLGAHVLSEPKLPDSIYMPLCTLKHLKIFDVVVFCSAGDPLPVPEIEDMPFRLAIAEHPMPRQRRRRSSQIYRHMYGEADLRSAERWMRDVLWKMKANLI